MSPVAPLSPSVTGAPPSGPSAGAPPALLQVRNLGLRFGGVHAIRDVSFDVKAGEVFAIIGPNGAGKTSVFNVVTRVFDPTAGSVTMDGVELTRVPRHRVVHHGVARTFQNIELFEGASVLDNLMLGAHRFARESFAGQCLWTRRVRDTEAALRAAVEDVIDLLELAPHRHSLVAGLPYGVRKVVELGRALATRPRLLLLDEPASGLNPEETRDLAFWIDDIRTELGITVVMVEHDMSLVSEVADRVLCMHLGEALSTGSPAQVQNDPAVVSAYLGS